MQELIQNASMIANGIIGLGIASNVKRNDIDFEKALEDHNPTLKSILKVVGSFQKHKEFDSRTQLLRNLDGSMKIQVLTVILKFLQSLDMVIGNKDGSWTWIYSKNNTKLKKSWDKAIKL